MVMSMPATRPAAPPETEVLIKQVIEDLAAPLLVPFRRIKRCFRTMRRPLLSNYMMLRPTVPCDTLDLASTPGNVDPKQDRSHATSRPSAASGPGIGCNKELRVLTDLHTEVVRLEYAPYAPWYSGPLTMRTKQEMET
jgi:hypothetical protein